MYDLEKMASEFKPGDKVYVLRKADNREHGWSCNWHPDIDCMVRKTSKVSLIDGDSVILEDGYHYPPFVLEKITCENPFKVGDKVRVRLPHKDFKDLIVERVDDLFCFEGDRASRHKYCTLIKSKKTWKLGCQTFSWDHDLFTSGTFNITRNQLKAIYDQLNSAFAPVAWEVGGYDLTFMDRHFWCQGRDLGTQDTLREILEYKEK